MNFKVKIDNIGKLKSASLSFRPLTVLAGPNSSGKSFVSKTLYSVFSSFGGEPTWTYMRHKLKPLIMGRADLSSIADCLYEENETIRDRDFGADTGNEPEELMAKAEKAKTPEEISDLKKQAENFAERSKSNLETLKIIEKNENLAEELQLKAKKIHEGIENIRLLCSRFDKMSASHAFPGQPSDIFRQSHRRTPLDGGLSAEPDSESAKAEERNPMRKFDQELDKILKQLLKSSEDGAQLLDSLSSLNFRERFDFFAEEIKSSVRNGSQNIKQATDNLKQIKSGDFARFQIKGFSLILEDSFTGNFQATVLRELKGDEKKEAYISFEREKERESSKAFSMCRISLSGERIQSDLSSIGLAELQAKSGAVFIESPFYWKLKEALLRGRERPSYLRFSRRKSRLLPKHFIDLDARLRDRLSGEMAFPEIFEEITRNIIKGKIVIDDSGSLYFKEFGRKQHSLPSTATGIVPLGMLALLIEKKALDKGTVLFIDEPETNLHPAWQVEMIKILFRLAREGAFVIVATHSIDMLKWLEARLEERPEDEKLVALNQLALQEDGSASSVELGEDIQEQIRLIKKDLARPFLKLFLEGVKSEKLDSKDEKRS